MITPTPSAPATTWHLPRRMAKFVAGLSLIMVLGIVGVATGSPSTSTALAAKPPTVHLYTTILSEAMIQHPGWPKFVPRDMTVPGHATVLLTIYNYDDVASPFASSSSPYRHVTGGTETVSGSAVTSVPAATISHTFTVPTLGLNVPIPAAPQSAPGHELVATVVVFTFKTKSAGSHTWRCFTPCASGANGMGGAMATFGYMKGSLQIA